MCAPPVPLPLLACVLRDLAEADTGLPTAPDPPLLVPWAPKCISPGALGGLVPGLGPWRAGEGAASIRLSTSQLSPLGCVGATLTWCTTPVGTGTLGPLTCPLTSALGSRGACAAQRGEAE